MKNISCNLKTNNWNSYSFSFSKFKQFKKEFYQNFKQTHWISIREAIPDATIREDLLKNILGFNRETDIFENWNSQHYSDINEETLMQINNAKELAKKILH